METVLIVGATGNIGVAATLAALRSGRKVLAIVRNQSSAEKYFKYVGTKEGITTVEADVLSEGGVQSVVDQVQAGKLPEFHHVYSAVGGILLDSPMHELDTGVIRKTLAQSVEPAFYAYRATVPYLLKQGNPNATWTLIAGAFGDVGFAPATAIAQGALYSIANVACLELADTNIRFNEVYLAAKVGYDAVVEETKDKDSMKSSYFARVYESILGNDSIRYSRVRVYGPKDVEKLQYAKKEVGFPTA